MTNEPTVVEAEVIENDLATTVNIDALKEGVLAIDKKIEKAKSALSDYSIEDDALSALSYKDAKRYEQDLSKMLTEADNERKAFKNGYNKPLNEIERRYKEAIAPVTELHARYKAQRIRKEQEAKDAKEAELKEHYEAYAGLLVDLVPYEMLHDPKWLNATTDIVKAKNELEGLVDRIAREWSSLKNLEIEHYEEAEECFFRTLDLSAAIARNAEITAARRKIEELKAAIAPEPEPEPEPVAYEAPPVYAPAPVIEEGEPMVMVIDHCTVEQAKAIGRFCGSLTPPVTGTFKRGTLLDAYRREYINERR